MGRGGDSRSAGRDEVSSAVGKDASVVPQAVERGRFPAAGRNVSPIPDLVVVEMKKCTKLIKRSTKYQRAKE